MRKLQKIFAVSATTAMTLAMGVSAFADTTVTYHFYNASKWDKVGAWVKQSIDWKDDCLPLDKCVLKDTIDGTAPHEPIWPGATMEAEGQMLISLRFRQLESLQILMENFRHLTS